MRRNRKKELVKVSDNGLCRKVTTSNVNILQAWTKPTGGGGRTQKCLALAVHVSIANRTNTFMPRWRGILFMG